MSPDELRVEAKRLRMLADLHARRGEENNREACLLGAESHERLADVIEYAEWVTYGCADPLGRWENPEPAFEVGASVLRLARGETNERESDVRSNAHSQMSDKTHMTPAQAGLVAEVVDLHRDNHSTHYDGCYRSHAGCLAARLHALDDEEDQ